MTSSYQRGSPLPFLLLLLLQSPTPTQSAIPTTYLDIRRTTTLPVTESTPNGGIEVDYLTRITATESNFAPSPPKAPKETEDHPISDTLSHRTANKSKSSSVGTGNGSSSYISKHYPSYQVTLPPDNDPYLCNEAKGEADYSNPAGNTDVFDTNYSSLNGRYVLVERGHCTFEAKARSAQRLGATGVIVRNTLDSRYGIKEEEDEDNHNRPNVNTNNAYTPPNFSTTTWPTPQKDYECGSHSSKTSTGLIGLRAEIETSKLNFDPPPYDGDHNNVLLSGSMADGNLCSLDYALDYDTFRAKCPSERCVLTGKNATEDGSKLEACCAWDIPQRMSTDGEEDGDMVPQEEEEEITIPALFITMKDGEELYQFLLDSSLNNQISSTTSGSVVGEVEFISVVPYARYYPDFHYSGLVLWVLAVFTLWIACYESGKEYRRSWKMIAVAVSEGILVFQMTGGGNSQNNGGRGRANTDDTMELGEDLDLEVAAGIDGDGTAPAGNSGVNDLEMSVEMTERSDTTMDTAAANGNESGTPNGDEFVDDDVNSSNASDTVEPTSENNGSVPTTNSGTGEAIMTSEDEIVEPATNEASPENSTSQDQSQSQPQPSEPQPQQINLRSIASNPNEMIMEINAFHAVLFVLVASAALFILFFFNLQKVVRVVYALGGSSCMSRIIFFPFLNRIGSKNGSISKFMNSTAFGNLPGIRGIYFSWVEVISFAMAYGMGIAWIYIGFNRVDPLTNAYYWIVQDIMGICYCILILGLIHINTIMVATVLLVLIFFYDIFYVFLTPYFFGSSVMIDVATGGGSTVDADYCEKYPFARECMGSQAPLPMLLTMPWLNDYRGGKSMIGLGDIIFPGLLVSFAARYDASKELVKRCSRTTTARNGAMSEETNENGEDLTSSSSRYHYHFGRIQKALFKGYFGPLCIAYAVGLIAAYAAVWGMNRGQPALLYLVPSCLGTMLVLGWKRGQLTEMWVGPKIMKKANRIVSQANSIPAVREAAARAANNTLAETTSIA